MVRLSSPQTHVWQREGKVSPFTHVGGRIGGGFSFDTCRVVGGGVQSFDTCRIGGSSPLTHVGRRKGFSIVTYVELGGGGGTFIWPHPG